MNPHMFQEIYTIMEASFPVNEIRTFEGQRSLLRNPGYGLLTEQDEGGSVQAVLAAWEFPNFRFVEHIAVAAQIRGGGLGRKLMSRYLAMSDKLVVLEVEPPQDQLQQRRIGFYERLGFCLNEYEYTQPPMREGQAELPLLLMTHPRPITEAEFGDLRNTLYTQVYRQSPPNTV